MLLLWVALAGSTSGTPEGEATPVLVPEIVGVELPLLPELMTTATPLPSRPETDPLRALTPVYASIEGIVVHETDALVAAWAEAGPNGSTALYLGLASGISPTDVAVFEVGTLRNGERIVSVTRAGVVVGGPRGERLLGPSPTG